MKKLVYLAILVGGLFVTKPAEAQVNVSINIGSQPNWGPVGYDYARYYYIPEIDVYYDISRSRYTYMQGRRWVTKRNLPSRYRNFNFYNTYKVVVNDRDPWRNHDRYRRSYGRYSNHRDQITIRDNRRSSAHFDNNRGRNNDRGRNSRIENRRAEHSDNGRGRGDRGQRNDRDDRRHRGEDHGRR